MDANTTKKVIILGHECDVFCSGRILYVFCKGKQISIGTDYDEVLLDAECTLEKEQNANN